MIDTTGGRLAAAHSGVSRILPAAQLTAMAQTEAWARGIIGFAPWPAGVVVDVSVVGGVRQYRARKITVPRGAQKAGLALHKAGSAWITPVAAGATADSGSQVTSLLSYWEYILNKTGGISGSVRQYAVPPYFVDETQAGVTITSLDYGGKTSFLAFPRPAGAAGTVADSSGDHHLMVIKVHSTDGAGHGHEFDCYDFEQGDVLNTATWVCCDSERRGHILGATGGTSGGIGCRACQSSLLGGLIWPHELAMGRIAHAICFTHPKQRADFVSPENGGTANGTVQTPSNPAGWNTRYAGYSYNGGSPTPAAAEEFSPTLDPEGVPNGALLQLDPTVDLDAAAVTYSWPAYQLTIAKAAQEYGMRMVDGGGYGNENPGLIFANPLGYASSPYSSIHADFNGNYTPAMRWAKDLRTNFRVVGMIGNTVARSAKTYTAPTDGSNSYSP